MICFISFILLLAGPVISKPQYVELNEHEQKLFRAPHETSSYSQNKYEDEDDMQLGQVDLVKDGLWAIKAMTKQLEAVNKALTENLLKTNLKIKDLLSNPPIKRNKQDTLEKEKPIHEYQPQPYPTYEPQMPQNGAHQYQYNPYYRH